MKLPEGALFCEPCGRLAFAPLEACPDCGASLGKPKAGGGAAPPGKGVGLAAVFVAAGLPEPVEEFRFCARRWRFDFCWPERKLALEVDGGVWTGGRHVRGKGFEADLDKLNEAALLGWVVLRVTPGMVQDGRALALVERAMKGGRP